MRVAPALALAAGVLVGCRGGGPIPGGRIEELEARVAKLEARLADLPAGAGDLADAELEEIAERLDSDDPIARHAASRALAGRLAESRAFALDLLRTGSTRQREGAAAAFASRPQPDSGSDLVLAHAANQDPRVRLWLDVALGRTASAEAVAPLAADLEHPALRVRIAAAEALGRLGEPAAAVPLVLAAIGRDPVVAPLARQAASRLDDLSLAAIESEWDRFDPRQREAILGVVGASPADSADRWLLTALSDPDPRVGLEAALVLAGRGSGAGRDLALERLGSEDPVIARRAREVLDALGRTLPTTP